MQKIAREIGGDQTEDEERKKISQISEITRSAKISNQLFGVSRSSRHLPLSLSLRVCVLHSLALSVFIPLSLSLSLSLYLSIYLSICLSIYLSVYLSIFYLSIYLFTL